VRPPFFEDQDPPHKRYCSKNCMQSASLERKRTRHTLTSTPRPRTSVRVGDVEIEVPGKIARDAITEALRLDRALARRMERQVGAILSSSSTHMRVGRAPSPAAPKPNGTLSETTLLL
jgi:hypothetical protein